MSKCRHDTFNVVYTLDMKSIVLILVKINKLQPTEKVNTVHNTVVLKLT